MRNMILAASMVAVAMPAVPAMAQNSRAEQRERIREIREDCREDLRDADNRGERRAERRDCREDVREARRDYRRYRDYDYNRPERGQDGYYADNYYRSGDRYQDRRLSMNDRVYRGRNGRYYCRRPDGTTGLIVGGLAGGVLGNIIAPGGSNTLGTILGAVAGGVGGRAIDRNNVRCD